MDDCVFYQRKFISTIYVENGIFASPSDADIHHAITEVGVKFDTEYQGTLGDFIEVNIEYLHNRNIKLS